MKNRPEYLNIPCGVDAKISLHHRGCFCLPLAKLEYSRTKISKKYL